MKEFYDIYIVNFTLFILFLVPAFICLSFKTFSVRSYISQKVENCASFVVTDLMTMIFLSVNVSIFLTNPVFFLSNINKTGYSGFNVGILPNILIY